MKFIKKLSSSNRFFNLFALGLIIFYTIICILVSLHRFWQYDAFHYDLSIYDAAIWKVSRFKPPIIDHLVLGGKWNFADHFTPSIFLFSPLYWFTQKTEMLMVMQSLCVGLGLIFAYLIAKKLVKNKIMILALLLAFMTYIGLQNAIISNFHPMVAAVLPFMVCCWAIVNKKWKIWWLALIILLGFKEDMSVVAASLGIYLFLKDKKTRKIGIITFILSLLYTLLVLKIVIPYFSGGLYYYPINFHRPILNWFTDLFWPLEKTKTLLVSLATFGFLPFFSLPTLFIIMPSFYARFVLSGGRDGLGLHYNALIAPLIFMASVEALKLLERKWPQKLINLYACLIIIVTLFFHQFVFHGALGLFFRKEFYANTQRNKFLNEFVDRVPKGGSLMSQNHLTPRFIHDHDQVYLLREKYWQYEPKYIVLELRDGQNPNNFWPLQDWAVKKMAETLKNDKNYELIHQLNEQYIFEKI